MLLKLKTIDETIYTLTAHLMLIISAIVHVPPSTDIACRPYISQIKLELKSATLSIQRGEYRSMSSLRLASSSDLLRTYFTSRR